MKRQNVVYESILLAVALMAAPGLVWGTEFSPAAELFSYGSSKGTFATVTEAARAAYDSYEIRLLRDVDEDIVIGDPDTWGNIPSRKFQLNGKRMRGTLTVYNTTLTFLAPPEGVTNRWVAGDLESLVFPKGTSGYLNFEDGNQLDLTQTDLTGCGGSIQGYGTAALLRVPQGFEQNLKDFNGIVHLAVNGKRLPFGYEPLLVKNPSRTFLYGPDGAELAVDEKGNFVVPGVKVWRAASKSGTVDLSDPAGWEGGVLPAAGERAVVYLDKATMTVSSGTKGPFEVADLRLVMKDLKNRSSDSPVDLKGTFTIGAGTGLLVSDVNLSIAPGQVACGSTEIGYACSVTLDGERIVSANLSGLGRVNIASNAKVEFRGSNTHSGGLIADGARVKVGKLSQLGRSKVIFGTDQGGSYIAPAEIELALTGDLDDSSAKLPQIVENGEYGTIRLTGTGIYTLGPVDWACPVVNELTDGIRLAKAGRYFFKGYSGPGGFRLDQVAELGVREVCLGSGNGVQPTELSVLLKPGVPVTEGCSLAPVLLNSSSSKLIRFSGSYTGAGYGALTVEGGVEFLKGSSWPQDVVLQGGYEATLAGAGTIGGDLILPERTRLVLPADGSVISVSGQVRIAGPQGEIAVELPRNARQGDVLLSLGGLENPSALTFGVCDPFQGAFTCGLDDATQPTALVITSKTPVAEVNGVSYPSLADAFTAAPAGAKVILLEDLFEDVTNTSPVTIQLNRKKIYGSVTAYADLVLKDSTTDPWEAGAVVGRGCDALTVGRPGVLDQDITVTVHVPLEVERDARKGSLMRLFGGTTRFSDRRIQIHGLEDPLFQSVEGGNANLTLSDIEIYTTAWPMIDWKGRGEFDCEGVRCNENPLPIRVTAGTVNLRSGRLAAYSHAAGGNLPAYIGSPVAVLQKDPRFPVTLNVTDGMELSGENARSSIYEQSETGDADKPSWPRLNIKGGWFGGEIYSASLEKGMPPFVTGGTFPSEVKLDALLPEGYATTPLESDPSFKMVYPLPAGGPIFFPRSMKPLSDFQTALLMSAIGKPAEGTTSTEIRFSDNHPESFTNCLYWGIAPKAGQDGTVQVASYALPKLVFTKADIPNGIFEVQVLPQHGTSIRSPLPAEAIRLMTGESLKDGLAESWDWWEDLDTYMKPESLGKFKLNFWSDPKPHFFRVKLQGVE